MALKCGGLPRDAGDLAGLRNTSDWSNFCMLLRRAGLTASAGLSCLALSVNISKTVGDTTKVTISD